MPSRVPSNRLLVVEDDDRARLALEKLLESEGFEVLLAGDGEEGFNLALKTAPDLIVLDLVLPRINGFDTARLLKQDSATASIPLIAATASWLGSDASRLREIGFEGALRKPYSGAELLSTVRQALRRGVRQALRRGATHPVARSSSAAPEASAIGPSSPLEPGRVLAG